ncbi:chloride channel protein [Dictyobacter alpinus]|uniref:Chloride channel protein n=1 Tax=Dictyobacter alpinus TaxID=2014873 RepID=A0A402BFL5_9CHLR|nr:chloride channel protein [Dictyobacter alpinus]GCE30126.1 chloride channel protein [Dictyobacter alpinus]
MTQKKSSSFTPQSPSTPPGSSHEQTISHHRGLWQTLRQKAGQWGNAESLGKLGDFTTSPRVIIISLLALIIGILGAFVALALLKLIGIFTNLFFFQRWRTDLVSPAGNHLGPLVIIVPVIGALIIGVMARYGSERIRGHGIPEAIESILINGSRIQPRVAILKPLSSAISIGSGGPFGAEGPIIMTGGAVGSMIAQLFHLTSAERKTLLVAGAVAGMSATFASPVAAVLLAVELLLFEWKPRSMVPVAIASATAAIMRRYLMGEGPLFPVPHHPLFIGPQGILGCVVAGILAGGMAMLLTVAVYAAEDAFQHLPIHWMWWPAIGGLGIGIGGFIFPQALGVGYDTIQSLLQGNISTQLILGVLLVKSLIWAFSLGSGTSGGVLAPLLMMGGALGGLESLVLPNEGLGFWPLISMAAILGGTMRSPFTGIIFALELTHDINVLLPLLVACTIAHGFTVLFMRRSILTEKISRRGYHLTREYATDPLEILFVRDVMRTTVVALSAKMQQHELAQLFATSPIQHSQRLYPVIDANQDLKGVLTANNLHTFIQEKEKQEGGGPLLAQTVKPDPVVCYLDEPLRIVVYRMAETNLTVLPVVERGQSHKLVGLVSLTDLLKARVRNLHEERSRERVLHLSTLFSAGQNTQTVDETVAPALDQGDPEEVQEKVRNESTQA